MLPSCYIGHGAWIMCKELVAFYVGTDIALFNHLFEVRGCKRHCRGI